MDSLTPAIRMQQLRQSLQWAEQLFARQPAELRAAYQESGEQVAAALTKNTFSFTFRFPDRIALEDSLRMVPHRSVQVGSLFNQIRKISCNAAILSNLNALGSPATGVMASCARLVAYLAARDILMNRVPDVTMASQTESQDADGLKNRVEQLSQYVEWLRTAEQLYPGWTADDLYNERYAQVVAELTEQGRLLATRYTDDLIHEVQESAQTGIRGLTLYIPYLDEQQYQMARYEVVVVPVSRIQFRPQFVVSACRIAQQEVRKNPRLSQSTRWQLVLQLDRVTQAFETHPTGGE